MIYFLYIPLALLSLIMGIGACYRAWSRAVPRVYWLAAFWFAFGVHLAFHPPFVIYLAGALLAVYWGAVYLYGSELAKQYEKLRPTLGETTEAPMNWLKAARLGETESRRKAEAKNRVAPVKEQVKAQIAVVKPKRIALDFSLAASQRYSVPTGGFLTLAPGPVHLDVLLQTAPWDEIVVLKITTSIADDLGAEWRSTSYMRMANSWLDALEVEGREFTPWDKAPIGWHKAIWWHTQVAAADELLDSRTYRTLNLGGQSYAYFEKYQGPKVDIAWVEHDFEWVVRVSELRRDLREAPADPAPKPADEVIPMFAWSVPGTLAALPLHRELHFASPDEIDDGDGTPITFSMTGKQLAAQSGVKFSM